jgi:hypothetical protein
MTIQELIETYKEQVSICAQVNYLDKKTVKANNDAVKKMYKLIETLKGDFSQEDVRQFSSLLDISDQNTNLWVAAQMLERLQLEKDIEQKALSVIKLTVNSERPEALGFQMWLKDWKAKKK